MSLTPDEIADHALRDISAAERQMRTQAEANLREYVRLLSATARHLAGEALEDARRNDPAATQSWQPAQWNAFFYQHILQPRQSHSAPGAGWGGGQAAGVQETPAGAPGQIAELNRQLAQLRLENQALRQQLESAPAVEPHRAPVPQKAAPDTRAAETPPSKRPPVESGQPLGHQDILAALSGWQTPRRPARFNQLSQVIDQRWERQAMALYVMASFGISARPEIDALLSAAAGVTRRTTALRGAVDGLSTLGLVERRKLEISAPFVTSLVVMRLSESGRELCQVLGWPVFPAEWERLEPLSDARLLCRLAFTAQARLRGYRACVTPPASSEVQPDVYLEKDPERSSVFTGGNGPRDQEVEELCRRWKTAAAQGLSAALCLVDAESQAQAVAQCRSGQPVYSGAAANLDTLLHQKQVTSGTPLWSELWSA